ncbi:MAG: hypothetical protein IPP04_03365 [Saprospiraceae bacterium]|nr:hypothetical protein [Saprospiraceae bacterium]
MPRPNPFYGAYRQQVGYIEVDVFFLQGQDLLVAHQANELMADRTIESMYLMPLQLEVTTHKGRIYPRRSQHLGLSIDIKTEGMSTLSRIVNVLEKYPDLLHAWIYHPCPAATYLTLDNGLYFLNLYILIADLIQGIPRLNGNE